MGSTLEDTEIKFVQRLSHTGKRLYINIPDEVKKAPYNLKPGDFFEVTLKPIEKKPGREVET